MPRPKKSFSPEYREEAVKLVIESSRPIARVAKELGTNPETGETGPQPVTNTITGDGLKSLVTLTIDTDGPHGNATGTLIATNRHPFWVESQKRWTNAEDLRPGDLLTTATGEPAQILTTHTRQQTRRVHNLTIADLHTYHVLAGTAPVLVHNTGPCGGDLGPGWKPRPESEICGSTGCEAVAQSIQEQIGGDIRRIESPVPGGFLGKYRGRDSMWRTH